jgi:hypothetical protein
MIMPVRHIVRFWLIDLFPNIRNLFGMSRLVIFSASSLVYKIVWRTIRLLGWYGTVVNKFLIDTAEIQYRYGVGTIFRILVLF